MMKNIFAFIFAVSFSAQAMAALNNPFDKTSTVDVGPEVKWDVKPGVANKTSIVSDKDGTFYQLRITTSEISLRLLSGATGKTESFDQLTIDDVQLDDKTSTLFLWCLSNQEQHSRFLQQGLKIKKDICKNNGKNGEFVMKLNQETYNLLKTSKKLVFTIKPYRGAVVVSFDVSDLTDVFAGIVGVTKAAAAEKKPVPSAAATKAPAAAPVVKAKPAKLCSIKPPVEFVSVSPVKYICNDEASKTKARQEMASSVNREREKKNKRALEQKKQKQLEAERLALEEQKRKEAEAVLITEQNTNKLRDQVSKKMISMCKKKWADGEHRCYCEPYLEFAPAGIKSDSSCSGG